MASATGIELGAVIGIQHAGGINQTQWTRLTAPIEASDTTVFVESTAGLGSTGALRINGEIVAFAGRTSDSVSLVSRGLHGTTPTTHATGSLAGQTTVHYTEVVGVTGTTVTLHSPAPVAVSGTSVSTGAVRTGLAELVLDGSKNLHTTGALGSPILWYMTRFGRALDLSIYGGVQGGFQLLHGARDNQVENLAIKDTGRPQQSMGAGFWFFRAAVRNHITGLNVSGDCYHAVYIDDRTRTGSEWDGPCNDNQINHLNVDIPRVGSNSGVMIVGSNRNIVRDGSISNVRSGIVVDSNQNYRPDGLVTPAAGNLIDGVSMHGTFQGVNFRQLGNRATNIPMTDVPVPIAYPERGTYIDVG
ncbi:hypothetical protein [Dietzia massiliensis]|uniref:hypothetical protein n=1 Tax=Dietzia massiliensis TaxID=2697499 RepID=UPI001BCDB569|nr:hypothetical protein [Dietzia massiliensis]